MTATQPRPLKPSRTVPTLSWSAPTRWTLRPTTVAVLFAGLWIFGTGEALFIHAGLGNSPWTVFAQGISRHTGVGVGLVTILMSAAIMLTWLPFDERPGFGTFANIITIGLAIDVMRPLVPQPTVLGWRIAQVVIAVVVCGFGCALYLSAHLGPGARDGLMTSLHRKFDQPIAWIRLAIEATVLIVGWIIGGDLGLGTAAFMAGIGHAMSWSFTAMVEFDHRVLNHPDAQGTTA